MGWSVGFAAAALVASSAFPYAYIFTDFYVRGISVLRTSSQFDHQAATANSDMPHAATRLQGFGHKT
jgi:hypothetical protein